MKYFVKKKEIFHEKFPEIFQTCNPSKDNLNHLGQDGKGLVIRGQHYLLISSISARAKLHTNLLQQL